MGKIILKRKEKGWIKVDILKRNNVNIIGKGNQTIICAHGFGCEQSMWQYITPAFTEKYRLVLFDYVGAGGSALQAYETDKYSSLHGYKQDVIEVMDELSLEQCIFLGHSISSMIGMLVAIERPELFEKMIMIGPSPCYLNIDNFQGGFDKSDVQELLEMMEMNFSGWASYMAPVGMGEEAPLELTKDLEKVFVSANPRIAREFAEVTFFSDQRHQLSKLRTNTLIIQCAEDSIVPKHIGEYLHQHILNSQLVIINAKGHYPHISHPSETARIITNFIESNEAI